MGARNKAKRYKRYIAGQYHFPEVRYAQERTLHKASASPRSKNRQSVPVYRLCDCTVPTGRNYENFLQLNGKTWIGFLKRAGQYHVNFPRIDLAIDNRRTYLKIPDDTEDERGDSVK